MKKKDWIDIELKREWRPEHFLKQPFLEFKTYTRGMFLPIEKVKKKAFRGKFLDFNLLTYNDFPMLVQYVDNCGKILPRRVTGLTAKQQRIVEKLIRQARIAAVLPFIMTAKNGLKTIKWKKTTFIRKFCRFRLSRKERKAQIRAGGEKPFLIGLKTDILKKRGPKRGKTFGQLEKNGKKGETVSRYKNKN